MVEVFSLILGMSIPWCGKIGKGKFPQSSLKAHFIFPSHGLAVMVKKNFPSRGFAAPGEIFVSPVAAPPLLGKLFFTNPAKPFLGKIKCAFRDSWGNFFFPSRGFATPGENPLPYFSTPRDWAITICFTDDIILFCRPGGARQYPRNEYFLVHICLRYF